MPIPPMRPLTTPARSVARTMVAVVLGATALTVVPTGGQADAVEDATARDERGTHLVTVDSTTTLRRAIDAVERMGGDVDETFERALLGLAVRLDADGLDALTRLPGVALVDPEVRVSSTAEQVDPPSWGLDRIDQAALPLDGRYRYQTSGSGVTVYVVDSGIRPSHTEFSGRVPYGAVYNYDAPPGLRWSGTVASGFEDCASGSGHGTHVAGIAGGSTHGIAKSVTVVPVKVLDCSGNGTDTAVIAAADWIIGDASARGPAVVVMSLGGDPSVPLDNAVRGLISAGVTVVVAAGNTADNACDYSPSRVGEAITVAGTTRSDRAMTSSAHGSCVDIFAPGDGITSAGIGSDSDQTVKSGTSMAAPHVAGVAARLLETNPSAQPADIWSQISANSLTGVVVNRRAGDPDRLLHLSGADVTLSIEIIGSSGSISLSNGKQCDATCQLTVEPGTELTLTASAPDGVILSSWGGSCALQSSVTCTLTPLGTTYVTATFTNTNLRDFEPVTPSRIVDTRTGTGGVPVGRVGSGDISGTPLVVTVAGRGGVPVGGVSAVSLNLTADQTSASGIGYVSAYPCDSTSTPRPGVSQLNFTNGQTVANSVIAPISANGTACIFVYGRAHIIADVTGWLPSGQGFNALSPSRVFDTRTGAPGVPAGRVGNAAGTAPPLVVDLLGRNGVPSAGVGAIALNLTTTNTSGSGYVSVYPCASAATAPPTVSNVNFTTGRTVPNSVILPVDAATAPGRTCFRVVGNADLIVDVAGWFASGQDLTTIAPVRALDTRTGVGGVSTTRVGEGGHRLRFDPVANGLVPAGATAVVLNLTATGTTASPAGYLTAYPCSSIADGPPNVSNVNFTSGATVANAAIVPLGAGGFCLAAYGATHAIADVSGWFSG